MPRPCGPGSRATGSKPTPDRRAEPRRRSSFQSALAAALSAKASPSAPLASGRAPLRCAARKRAPQQPLPDLTKELQRSLPLAPIQSGGGRPASLPLRDDLIRRQAIDLVPAKAQPALEYLARMLTQHGRGPHGHWRAVVPNRPTRHHITLDLRVVHGLQDAPLMERPILGQLLGIKHGARWDTGGTDDLHRRVLVVLARPRRHDGVHLLFALGAVSRCCITLVADQILTADDLQETLPVLGIGAAGVDIDIVVGPAALALEDATRRIATRHRLITSPLDRPARARLRGKGEADIVQHGVLHGDL